MSPPHTVTVRILDKDYQVACPAEQEAELLVSAKYLDKQMRGIRETLDGLHAELAELSRRRRSA